MPRKGRPKCLRIVKDKPKADYFKPRGVPLKNLDSVTLKLEEMEAMRLVDLKGFEHKKAAEEMKVSRRTLARDLKKGRKELVEALVEGKAIEIRGGFFATEDRIFLCRECGHEWVSQPGKGRPDGCPDCGEKDIQRRVQDE
ncbi:MAG: hypothetical protein B6U72_02040 [Candidatus Altiarchaeales archaeon ex4484_2]|nr:MAG: hypothetical protein B6U72_02040 [Candidatus Altiarchaeales archaeon ex4484_2]